MLRPNDLVKLNSICSSLTRSVFPKKRRGNKKKCFPQNSLDPYPQISVLMFNWEWKKGEELAFKRETQSNKWQHHTDQAFNRWIQRAQGFAWVVVCMTAWILRSHIKTLEQEIYASKRRRICTASSNQFLYTCNNVLPICVSFESSQMNLYTV